MNNRIRQICRVQLEHFRNDNYIPATIEIDGSPFRQMVFIPPEKLEAVKAEYGDKLNVWYWAMNERRPEDA